MIFHINFEYAILEKAETIDWEENCNGNVQETKVRRLYG